MFNKKEIQSLEFKFDILNLAFVRQEKELRSIKAINTILLKQIKELKKIVETSVLMQNRVEELSKPKKEVDLSLYDDDPELQNYIKYYTGTGLSVADAEKKFWNSGEKYNG